MLAGQGIPSLRVIVVDNGSTDGAHEYHRLAARTLCLIDGRNLGSAAAVNGAGGSAGRVLVVLLTDLAPVSARFLGHLGMIAHGLIGPVSNEGSHRGGIGVACHTQRD